MLLEVAKIGDHAAIGDGRSVALITSAGTIDWLCWPRVDSPSIFAAVLDPVLGGAWAIGPSGPAHVSRRYVSGTNVLDTRFVTETGELRLVDAMTLGPDEAKPHTVLPEHELLRIATCVRGSVEVEVRFEPRPGYGARASRLVDARALGIRCEIGSELLVLRAGRPLALDPDDDGVASARFVLRAGDEVAFSLTFADKQPAVLPPLESAGVRILETIGLWRAWLDRSRPRVDSPYVAPIERSLLVLKLLDYPPSGAIVAAATTSLPETIGGPWNWDYRFCWLRDASFVVRALLELGYHDEATSFTSWLLHTTRLTAPALKVLYDVFGNAPSDERVLGHLAGHRGSTPVRINNRASSQQQLDVYGEVIDAAERVLRPGMRADHETQRLLRGLGDYVVMNWREPDHGIWEDRRPARHYTHSKVLCWVALDRLVRLQADGRVPDLPVPIYAAEREAIRRDILEHGYDPTLRSYVAMYGSRSVDASLLLLAWYGFESASSPRMRGTYHRIAERLQAGPGLYYRTEDRLPGEGAFGICSFWVAEFLAMGGGSLAEARLVFEAVLARANDLLLFGEEIDPVSGEALGNFPQAYTHVGLINAAMSLAMRARRTRAAARSAPSPEVRP